MLGMGGGTRKRGRPHTRWFDDINAVTNCTLTKLCDLARYRDACGRWSWESPEVARGREREIGNLNCAQKTTDDDISTTG